jgi:hypothetical protein
MFYENGIVFYLEKIQKIKPVKYKLKIYFNF